MIELSSTTAEDYLRARGLTPRNLRELGGGVSNAVIYAEIPQPIVVKQSLGKLRVEQDWFSDRERIHRECDAIRMLGPLVAPGGVPELVFEDRDNCIYAMAAAPAEARDWKTLLLAGLAADAAEPVARLLAGIIRATHANPGFEARFVDRRVFDQLRLDPYYRAAAARHPDLGAFFDELIAETLERRVCLVHGDWSPKNLLVSPSRGAGVMAIDFEVVHYGDPAFDAAFLINHLILKSLHLGKRQLLDAAMRFFATVQGEIGEGWFERAVARHSSALLLARVDGKSPAEYIRGTANEGRVRTLARDLILHPAASLAATMERAGNA